MKATQLIQETQWGKQCNVI